MSTYIDKNTNNDKRKILSTGVDVAYKDHSVYLLDFDDTHVYFESWENGAYKNYGAEYTISGTVATVSSTNQEVVKLTDFQAVETEDTKLTDTIINIVTKHFGGTKKPDLDVIKQFGTEEGEPLYAIEPLYTAPQEVDGHGDTADLETITGMVNSLNKANEEGRLQSGLFHKHKTTAWHLDKAWVNPVECMIGDQLVPEGQPIAKTIFTNEAAFQMRLNGDISGLSIGARAKEFIDLTKSSDELAKLQSSPEAVREIKGINFDWDHPELTYTSPSQGGAASMKNDAYLIDKAKKAKFEDLDEDQLSIIEQIGEEFVSLDKTLGDDTKTPSLEEGIEGETIDKTGTTDMSEQAHKDLLKELGELRKENAINKAHKDLVAHELGDELSDGVAAVYAELDKDAQAVISKAFAHIKAAGVESLDKAVAAAKVVAAPEAETELQKALDAEAGEGGEPEADVEKSFLDQIKEFQDLGENK